MRAANLPAQLPCCSTAKRPPPPSYHHHHHHLFTSRTPQKLINTKSLYSLPLIQIHSKKKPTTAYHHHLLPSCTLNDGAAASTNNNIPQDQEFQSVEGNGFWSKWKASSAKMSSELAKLGLAAVLAYGLFDAVTYTIFFILAFMGYEKSTGKNPAANIQALLGIVILMWTGNNVTRPFRVAGAAALAPIIDKGLKKIQRYFNLPNLAYAFALVVSVVAGSCFTIVGLLILSRWGK